MPYRSIPVIVMTAALAVASLTAHAGATIDAATREAAVQQLIERHGESSAGRIRDGVGQVADRWWTEDGDAAAFVAFCVENFIADEAELDVAFLRLEAVMEQIDGHLHEIRRELTAPVELDTGDVGPVDQLFSKFDLATHVEEDLYAGKIAFLALLNFRVHTLEQRLHLASTWDRQDWARSRMMDRFALRVPASVSRRISLAFTDASRYIDEYNVRMDRLASGDGSSRFPEGLRLISHWGLRDELKSQYAEPDGIERQRMILEVMQRIVRQEIPAEVIDSGDYVWNPATNGTWRYDAGRSGPGEAVELSREPDTRYARLLEVYHAVREADPYSPVAPSFIARRFDLVRGIPEQQVEAVFDTVLRSEEFKDLAAEISRRLGRPLEAFDIWYDGFKSRGTYGEAELDGIVAERYPDVAAFQADLPRILSDLGFSIGTSQWLSERIVVDPSRGAGHATGAVRREDAAHLRTRFGPDGMDYKGYNIAVHELGHNVEQVFSLNGIDYWWLNGVPNNAFTEALAFVFQNRDLELLGLDSPGENAGAMEALDTLWGTAEIGGVALVDMAVWRFMYEHPEATPAELRQATVRIAKDVWNRYFAPAFGVRDQEILAIYSHMIAYGLYLPDYPLGHIIAFQIAERMRQGDFGAEFERVSRQGRLTPDAWMRGAVGSPLSPKALLKDSRKALESLTRQGG